ncbi:Rv3654c family TadE-like protein, partial [Streptomyces platensis]|uniref:Rv3654c family TadE-like protein n=1 Tax=Streptomyces platensis TaxID=58346 RepID=UPI0036A2E184
MRKRRYGDEGSATVWTVFAAAALCAVFVALVGVGQAVVARHRAGGAADLAALAAADHALQGPAVACAAARRVAAAQHTRLVRCAVTGQVSDVSAEAGSRPFTSRVRARAGPPGRSDPARPRAEPAPAAAIRARATPAPQLRPTPQLRPPHRLRPATPAPRIRPVAPALQRRPAAPAPRLRPIVPPSRLRPIVPPSRLRPIVPPSRLRP